MAYLLFKLKSKFIKKIVCAPGLTALTMLVYWGLGSVYILLDLTNWPLFMRKYKVQPGTNEPVDGMKLIKVGLKCTINWAAHLRLFSISRAF
jgi:hypothetical protein